MAKTEVTNSQYARCVSASACSPSHCEGISDAAVRFGGVDRPIVCVDWSQSKAFCEWAGGRLSTEAEWEYAAKSAGKNWKYPWGDEAATCSRAVMGDRLSGCGKDATWPVCSKKKGNTRQGLCDMSGNVWEWVNDWYAENYYARSPRDNPQGPDSGLCRVIRGGAFGFKSVELQATRRYWAPPDFGGDLNSGFRCAKSLAR